MENGAVILDTTAAEEKVGVVPFSEVQGRKKQNMQWPHFLLHAFLLGHCAIQKLVNTKYILLSLCFRVRIKDFLSCRDGMVGFLDSLL